MSVTLQEIKQHLDRHDIKYVPVDDNRIGIGVKTPQTNLHYVLTREEDGEYLCLRSIRYATCPKDHPALAQVHAKLVELNYEYKLAKFGWDEDDGEIVAEMALPLEDAPLESEQLLAMFALLTKVCGEKYAEINAIIESGGRGRSAPAGLVASTQRETRSPPQLSSQREAPAPSPPVVQKSDPTRWLLAFGVIAMGVAALGGVAYLFLR